MICIAKDGEMKKGVVPSEKTTGDGGAKVCLDVLNLGVSHRRKGYGDK